MTIGWLARDPANGTSCPARPWMPPSSRHYGDQPADSLKGTTMPYICQTCGKFYCFGACPECFPPIKEPEKPMYKIKPICSRCGITMDVHMQGVILVEMAFNPPSPYALVSADEYKCRSCSYRIISGFGDKPFSRHHDEDFKSRLLELANTNPMKIRVQWEHLPTAIYSEDPVAYLLEWLRTERMAKATKEERDDN